MAAWRLRQATHASAESEFEAVLKDGARSGDTDLEISCALQRRDDESLEKYEDRGPPALTQRIRVLLGAAAGPRALSALRSPDESVRLTFLRALRRPLSAESTRALLEGAALEGDAFRAQALSVLMARPASEVATENWVDYSHLCQALQGRLGAASLLELLAWASRPDATPGGAAVFAPHVTAALRSSTREHLLEGMRSEGFRDWLVRTGGPEEQNLLEAWVVLPETVNPLVEALFRLHEHRTRAAPDLRAVPLLVGLWEGAGDQRGALIDALASATQRGVSRHDPFVEAFWYRFVRFESERREILRALWSWRADLWRCRDASAPELRPEGADPVCFLAVYGDAVFPELSEQVKEALRRAGARVPWAALIDQTFALACAQGGEQPGPAIRGVATIASALVNRYRSEPVPTVDLVQGVAMLRLHVPRLRAVADESRVSSPWAQIDVELRLAREHDQRIEERERRRQEQAAQVAAQRRQAEEREEHRLQQLEERAAAATQAQKRSEGVARASLEPRVDAKAIDDQMLVPGSALPTVRDYARFLKKLSEGNDALAVMRVHQLDPVSWTACAEAWANAFRARPEAAMRFGELMQAEWR